MEVFEYGDGSRRQNLCFPLTFLVGDEDPFASDFDVTRDFEVGSERKGFRVPYSCLPVPGSLQLVQVRETPEAQFVDIYIYMCVCVLVINLFNIHDHTCTTMRQCNTKKKKEADWMCFARVKDLKVTVTARGITAL